jgi:predicted nucleic acid-binding protein
VIYVDTSVVLAHILAEDRRPAPAFWDEALISSQLTRYETWVRLHAAGLAGSHGDEATSVLGRLRMVSLVDDVVGRATEPFPLPVRTLDALHLATVTFLRQMADVSLATYDTRMAAAAQAIEIELYQL